ncbi:hypothetical protein AX14_005698 [Amanita brunnescens Koide BX004]|nr:hypothetical protein AX14_005698 [Amanita brunnescens Koide BX004]
MKLLNAIMACVILGITAGAAPSSDTLTTSKAFGCGPFGEICPGDFKCCNGPTGNPEFGFCAPPEADC